MNPATHLPDVGEHIVHPRENTGETQATAREVMLRHPKTLAADASIAQARAALSDDHVHMVLLTKGRRLVGTLTRTDLPQAETSGGALWWAILAGRTVSPDASTAMVQRLLIDHGIRRVAVVALDGSLLGLMCLKRRRTGFCSDADVEARSRSRDETTSRVGSKN